jgi:O-antigen/teichoic acid export membrane protein
MQMLAGTVLASALTMAIVTLFTGALAGRLGPDQFGAYLLANRVVALVLPFSTVAVAVGLPRSVALAREEADRSAYLVGGLILGVLPGLALAVACASIPDVAARLLFGSTPYRDLLRGTLCLLVGYSCYSVLYGYYRGLSRMGTANLWQLLVLGIGPAVVVYNPSGKSGVGRILFLMGLAACAALGALFMPVIAGVRSRAARARLPGALADLSQYGLPRTTGGVALQWLLALGPFMAARHGGMAAAGYLLAGQTVFRIADVATAAFGTVVLPRVVVLQSEGKEEYLRQRINDIVAFICHLGVFATLHLLVWSRPLMLTWLGASYGPAVPVMQIMLTALVPYIAYVMLRSIIDGVERKAVNTLNVCLSLLATSVASYLSLALGLGPAGLAAAAALGLWCLAALSVLFLWKRCQLRTGHLMPGPCAGLNAALLMPSVLMVHLLHNRLSGLTLLTAGAALEGCLLTLYCLVLWRLHARWTTELFHRILPAARTAHR